MLFDKRPSYTSINNKPQSSLEAMIKAAHESRKVKPLDQGTARVASHFIKAFDILNRYLGKVAKDDKNKDGKDGKVADDKRNVGLLPNATSLVSRIAKLGVILNGIHAGDISKIQFESSTIKSRVEGEKLIIEDVKAEESQSNLHNVVVEKSGVAFDVSKLQLGDAFVVKEIQNGVLSLGIKDRPTPQQQVVVVDEDFVVKECGIIEVRGAKKDITIRIPPSRKDNTGKRMTIIKGDSEHSVLINSPSPVNGSHHITLTEPFSFVTIMSNGSGRWYIIESK